MPTKVGVYGATGYTGLELVQWLERHPDVRIAFLTSETSAGLSLRQSWPLAPDLPLVAAAEAPLSEVDCVFLCLPHTRSAPLAAQALAAGVRVIDLSADLRIDDPAVYRQWYGVEHPTPDLLPVPYGLPELGRDKLAGAKCIANPGCYATATLLATAPLVRHDLLVPGTPLIVDAKSGVSGAGRTPKQNILFGEVYGNFSPYNIGHTHRHLAEIEQLLAAEGSFCGPLIFSPHLLPTDRGILATVYAQVKDMDAIQEAFMSTYAREPLVRVLPPGELATLGHVVRTPSAILSLTPTVGNVLIIIAVLDNLLKGAASQAIQNFNLMFGFPEIAGLLPC
ncbi:MAG TPA: N-acetyl-gamma-glutamyl-phosphate reductase [Aggregatilineaceae bacterium]|nr:N-acetyl-gamma-glutamyl-phosphate reductase [Aggregatilineaceae bacterium]